MKISIFVLLLFCMGCVRISHTSSKGETFKYFRLGTQKINGFELSQNTQGSITVKFENQEGTGGALAETMKNISELLVKTSTRIP